MSEQEIFVDGIGKIHLTAGMVRFDMISFDPVEDGKEPIPREKVRIIMPPEGFLSAFNTMQKLIDQLVAKGVLQKKEKPEPAQVQ